MMGSAFFRSGSAESTQAPSASVERTATADRIRLKAPDAIEWYEIMRHPLFMLATLRWTVGVDVTIIWGGRNAGQTPLGRNPHGVVRWRLVDLRKRMAQLPSRTRAAWKELLIDELLVKTI